jgi:hypothetical protein
LGLTEDRFVKAVARHEAQRLQAGFLPQKRVALFAILIWNGISDFACGENGYLRCSPLTPATIRNPTPSGEIRQIRSKTRLVCFHLRPLLVTGSGDR